MEVSKRTEGRAVIHIRIVKPIQGKLKQSFLNLYLMCFQLQAMSMAQLKQAAGMIRKVCQPKTGVATGNTNHLY
jgi:hypothetical protein